MAVCDFPGCDKGDGFPGLAFVGTYDNREVPSTDPEGWREFEAFGPEKRGCVKHPPTSLTYYLDGRVLRTVDCVSELI
jgi:hypothetical protein